MKKEKDRELVTFTLGGVGKDSREAIVSMSAERYKRIMPPSLNKVPTLIAEGSLDERCSQAGHAWGPDEAYLGDMRNGVYKECGLCGQGVVRRWIK